METIMNKSLCICGCCKREASTGKCLLYETNVPVLRTTTAKNVVRQNARRHRNQDKSILFENKSVSYPVITEVKDYALRMFLIRHARQVVSDSIRRKQEKEKLRALWEE